jgi:hypothetical protein|uniref:Uncharacterized protein n=1 Tax=Picea glauca TaxID=3330 RepID=A0A117NHQ6_PICGL|nr:hypothetical protein ABT39_MTgene4106 [Picea glauca]QHR92553.1 hypothetical protein Q903MT_gene6599 [Picea sitchensis]
MLIKTKLCGVPTKSLRLLRQQIKKLTGEKDGILKGAQTAVIGLLEREMGQLRVNALYIWTVLSDTSGRGSGRREEAAFQ